MKFMPGGRLAEAVRGRKPAASVRPRGGAGSRRGAALALALLLRAMTRP
jgi:hypothetical protein